MSWYVALPINHRRLRPQELVETWLSIRLAITAALSRKDCERVAGVINTDFKKVLTMLADLELSPSHLCRVIISFLQSISYTLSHIRVERYNIFITVMHAHTEAYVSYR